jgi:hypothetical protein
MVCDAVYFDIHQNIGHMAPVLLFHTSVPLPSTYGLLFYRRNSVGTSKTSVVTNFSDVILSKITFLIGTEIIIIINCIAISLEYA